LAEHAFSPYEALKVFLSFVNGLHIRNPLVALFLELMEKHKEEDVMTEK
jgi:hypothetical protein